jgi:hypothetical protein
MAALVGNRDQQHPQEKRDKEIVERLLQEASTDYNKVELARLRIRYCGFPGAREIQQKLDAVLQQWGLTEEQLFEMTRKLHAIGQAYKQGGSSQDDWT